MKSLSFRLHILISTLAAISGCVTPGVGVQDDSLGYNGSFEVVRSDLPANWILSRYPLEKGDAEAFVDTLDAVDGERSLKMVVHRYAETDRWKPFLFQVREVNEGETYTVGFWLKNRGCKILLEIGYEGKYHMFGGPSEAEKQDYAAHPRIREVLGEPEMGNDEWRQFQYRYTVPESDGTIRFELKFLQTGTLWIDDVRIERASDAEPEEQATKG